MLKVDVKSDSLLEILAEKDSRTKIGEFRFLLRERAKQLGLLETVARRKEN
jgi:hypothetical protein